MTAYAAHIITDEAAPETNDKFGHIPEIIIAIAIPDDAAPTAPFDTIAVIPWRFPEHRDKTSDEMLAEYGWSLSGESTLVEPGYYVCPVQPADWAVIVKSVTIGRTATQVELDQQNKAWRTVIEDAMNDPDTVKMTIADAAEISRPRAYQIRDGL